jgi:hypothetical protein
MEDNHARFTTDIDPAPKHRARITPAAYGSILEELKLSHAQVARLLGVAPRSSQRWMDGTREVPAPIYRFLVLLRDFQISPDEAYRHFSRNLEQTRPGDTS